MGTGPAILRSSLISPAPRLTREHAADSFPLFVFGRTALLERHTPLGFAWRRLVQRRFDSSSAHRVELAVGRRGPILDAVPSARLSPLRRCALVAFPLCQLLTVRHRP